MQLAPNYDRARVTRNLEMLGLSKGNAYDVMTDAGTTPPTEYRMYKDGRITNISGTLPYAPTGIAASTKAETLLYVGQMDDGKGGKREVRFRYGSTGSPVDEMNKPIDPSKLSGVHTIGAKESSQAPVQPHIINAQTTDGKPLQLEQTASGALVDARSKQPVDPETIKPGSMQTGTTVNQEAARATAEAIYEFRQPPLSGYALRSGSGPQILKELQEIGQERGRPFDAKQYYPAKTLMDGYGRTTPNSPGGQLNSINTATQHMDQLRELAVALQNKSIPAANVGLNYVKTQLGHPEVTNFDQAAAIVGDEVIKAVVGGGAAVYDREGIQKRLSNTKAPEQILQGLDTLKGLMGGRANTMLKQWSSLGLDPDQWVSKLTDETRDAVEPYLKERERSAQKRSEAAPSGTEKPPMPPVGSPPQQGAAGAAPTGPSPKTPPPPIDLIPKNERVESSTWWLDAHDGTGPHQFVVRGGKLEPVR